MSRQLFLRFSLSPKQAVQWLHYDQQRIEQGSVEQEQLQSISDLSRESPAIVLLPGQLVTHCRTKLDNQSKLAIKALPYQLEEQLSSPIESLHLAISTPLDNWVSISVIERLKLETYLTLLAEAQIEIKACYADYQLLPDSELCGWQDADSVLIRGPGQGCSLDNKVFPAWWEQSVHSQQTDREEAGDEPASTNPQLTLFGHLETLPAGCVQQPAVDDLLLVMAENYLPKRCINLLQGLYLQKDPLLGRLELLRWPLTLLFIIALIHSLSLYTGNLATSQQLNQTKAAIEAEFRHSFPKARNLVKPHAQMKYQLSKLEQRYNQTSLLEAIDKVKPLFSNASIRPTGLNFQAESNTLKIQLKSTKQIPLDQIKQSLKHASSSITLTTFVPRGAGYESELTYSPVGGTR